MCKVVGYLSLASFLLLILVYKVNIDIDTEKNTIDIKLQRPDNFKMHY